MKDNAVVGIANEDAIDHDYVDVHVEVQAAREARTKVTAPRSPAMSHPAACAFDSGEDRLDEQARHRAEHLALRRALLERRRRGVHAHGHVGEHAVDQVRRRVRVRRAAQLGRRTTTDLPIRQPSWHAGIRILRQIPDRRLAHPVLQRSSGAVCDSLSFDEISSKLAPANGLGGRKHRSVSEGAR